MKRCWINDDSRPYNASNENVETISSPWLYGAFLMSFTVQDLLGTRQYIDAVSN